MLLVSDIHFGTTRAGDVDAFLRDATDPGINPERIVVIAGDITERATKGEFEKAERFLEQLIRSGAKVIYTPGNHDLGGWVGEYVRADRKAREWTRGLLGPVFSQKEVAAASDYDSILRFGEDIFVVLRSTHRGEVENLGILGINRITRKQAAWAHAELARMETVGCRLHFVTHRSLWKESGDRHSGMMKRGRLETSLIEPYKFHSFIHGHNHRFIFAHTTTPTRGVPIIRLALPTLSSRNHHWQAGYVRWDFPYDRTPRLIARQDGREPKAAGKPPAP